MMNNTEDESSKYDPNAIMRAAEEKRKQNDVSGAQMMYQSALLDWVDSAREGTLQNPDQVREAIATLWIAYAQFNASNNMYKSATEAYEQAVSCEIAGSVGRVWLDYARFAQEREKLRTAQQIYLRALVGESPSQSGAVTDVQDRALLWSEFLEMMRQTKPSLTMAELKQAVEQEHLQSKPVIKEEEEDVPLQDAPDSASLTQERPAKRPKTEESKTHVVTPQTVADEANQLLVLTQEGASADIKFAWSVRDGSSPPTPPEPPLFSASPPKLADATGKDIMGPKMALDVIKCLLNPSMSTILLEVCRGLWMLTALREKEFGTELEKRDQEYAAELEQMESTYEARLSVAGAASMALQQSHEIERTKFTQDYQERRQALLDKSAWGFRDLLYIQQQVLTKLQVPGFDGPTVDASVLDLQARVCSYLHSAFYIRSRIGQDKHHSMLKSQAERLETEVASAPPEAPTNVPPPPPPPAYAQQMPPPPMYNAGYTPQLLSYHPMYTQQQQYQGQVMQQPQQGMPPQQQQGVPPGNLYGQQQHPPPYYQ